MGAWIDYKQIKAQVSVLDVLQLAGIELQQRDAAQYFGSCPLPNHAGDRDNRQAFSANTTLNCWRCFTHCGSGNVIDLHALLTNRDPKDKSDFREAANELQERFLYATDDEKQIPESNQQKKQKTPEKENKSNPPLKFTLTTKRDIPFLLKEKNLPLDLLKYFDVGYCAKGMFAGRVTVPIHNREGELVGYAGRGLKIKDIQSRGKWMFPKGFHKSVELFNQHRLSEYDNLDNGLVVVEGFWSVMRLHQAGIPAVALFGSEMSLEQKNAIVQHSKKIILMLDNDEAGQKATNKIALSLMQEACVCIVPYPVDDDERTQPDDFTPDELRIMIAGE